MLLPPTPYELPSMPAVRPSRPTCFHGQMLAAFSAAFFLCVMPAWAVNNNRRTAIVVAVEEAKQCVVNIHGRKSARSGEALPDGKHVNGMGTGIILDPRGYIIT